MMKRGQPPIYQKKCMHDVVRPSCQLHAEYGMIGRGASGVRRRLLMINDQEDMERFAKAMSI